jgi:hypothetical protein
VILNHLISVKNKVQVLNLTRLCLVLQQQVVAEVLLAATFFDQRLDNVIVAHMGFPAVEPPPRNQVEFVIKFAPICLVQDVEILSDRLRFVYFALHLRLYHRRSSLVLGSPRRAPILSRFADSFDII